jgi:NADP-dependent aldehyde dehydrogenase
MITGEALIGGVAVRGEGAAQRAFNPGTEQQFGEEFNAVSVEQVNDACRLAGAAFDTFRAASDAARAELLDAIARNILDLGAELIERAMAETGLPQARLEGERARTCNQLKMFATLLVPGAIRASMSPCLPALRHAPTCATA